ncbi:polysaccharide deacetylase family protein [Kitasatospora sp. NPDC051170]|uniref:polysaccharide deacetylase family protein n=1 Tax=Kitasatospora sp. NPDC051170 TaxID=3364056 RepID=UPI00379DC5C4
MALRIGRRSAAGRFRTAIGALVVALTAGAVVAVPAAEADAAGSKVVYLTFDDGPSTAYTPKVLNVLARYGVRATFFEVGQEVTAHPSVTGQVAEQGHSVQNHSWSHPDLSRLSASAVTSQVSRTDQAIRAQTGRTPSCLRPPYGSLNSTVRSRAAALGKQVVLWSVDPQDWARPGTGAIESRVLRNVRPGSVILMHDGGGNRSQTVDALPTIISTLKARGYTFGVLCR